MHLLHTKKTSGFSNRKSFTYYFYLHIHPGNSLQKPFHFFHKIFFNFDKLMGCILCLF